MVIYFYTVYLFDILFLTLFFQNLKILSWTTDPISVAFVKWFSNNLDLSRTTAEEFTKQKKSNQYLQIDILEVDNNLTVKHDKIIQQAWTMELQWLLGRASTDQM